MDQAFVRRTRATLCALAGSLVVGAWIGAPSTAQAIKPQDRDTRPVAPVASGWGCDPKLVRSEERCGAVDAPANAFGSGASYGRGWECHRGYRVVDEACAKVLVPEHAYLTSSGSWWNCERGYRDTGESCERIIVPANAFLTEAPYNRGWACERGFRVQENLCEPILVPEHGYLTSSSFGAGWRCERGYSMSESTCVWITVPSFAHLNYNGDGWECDRPYRRVGTSCAAP